MKIKTGDTVVVIAGKDAKRVDKKGNPQPVVGKVIKAFPKDNMVIVEGVNMVKKSTKPSQTSKGGIVEKEAPIHVSNVMIQDTEKKVPTRVGYKIVGEGDKASNVRYAKKSGALLDK